MGNVSRPCSLLRDRHDRPLGFSKRRRVPTSPPRPPDPRALTTASAATITSISSKSLVNASTTPPLLIRVPPPKPSLRGVAAAAGNPAVLDNAADEGQTITSSSLLAQLFR